VDLVSYVDDAVRLVNTVDPACPGRDELADLPALQSFLAARPQLRERATDSDLPALIALRGELREVFESVEREDARDAVDRLNQLLVDHPVRPQISGHDDSDWHLHLTERGGAAERYAASAVMGVTVLITSFGIDRLGVCQARPCRKVFVDTSTNRSRRYCSDRCATRANVAAYRARRREAALNLRRSKPVNNFGAGNRGGGAASTA
jgi:predicted RNA-binding Zn ribbon-like protein